MAQNVTLDPIDPKGTESLRLGAGRIRAIAANVLRVFGFPGTIDATFKSPFAFEDATAQATTGLVLVNGDPTADLGIATKQFATGRAVMAAVSDNGTGGTLYTTTTVAPAVTAYALNVIYIVTNIGLANVANAQIQIDTAPIVALRDRQGNAIAAGNFAAGGTYLLVYDGTNLRVMDFIGGLLPQPLFLLGALDPTDPNYAIAAATVGYVAGTIAHPVRTLLAVNNVAVVQSPAVLDVLTVNFTTPNDGDSRVVAVEYSLQIAVGDAVAPVANAPTVTWIVDNSPVYCAPCEINQPTTTPAATQFSGSGIIPTVYPPNTPVVLKLQANTFQPAGSSHTRIASPFPPLPSSYLSYTLMRTT